MLTSMFMWPRSTAGSERRQRPTIFIAAMAALALAGAAAGCTTASSPEDTGSSHTAELKGDSRTPPELMARCNQLYGLWAKYEAHGIANQSSQDTAAEVALSECQHNDFSTGVAGLEKLLGRDKIPFSER